MALQGTLDTFALADVLRLLANTRKSGRLALTGDRGDGRVWFGEGQLVGGEAPAGARTDGMADVVFHLLRFGSGDFAFEADDLPSHPSGPFDVEQVLADAQEQLEEWEAIEAVVPSMRSWISLRRELADPDAAVTLTAADWAVVVSIGSGTAVADLGAELDLADLDACRVVKDLVERDLAQVGDAVEAPSEAPPAGADAQDDGDAATSEPDEVESAEYFAEDGVSHTARTRLDVLAAAAGVGDERPAGNDDLRTLMPEPLPGEAMTNGQLDAAEQEAALSAPDDAAGEDDDAPVAEEADEDSASEPVEDEAAPAPVAENGTEDTDLARQLSSLSPQAAAAIASAAGSLETRREAAPRTGRRRSGSRLR